MRCVKPNGNDPFPIIDPTVFNTAFDEMITPQLLPGDVIKIDGMTGNGIYAVSIPVHEWHIRIQMGDTVWDKQPRIEQVGIEVDENRAFILYRYAFKYTIIPRQQRIITLQEK
jgi:hypothetical protein